MPAPSPPPLGVSRKATAIVVSAVATLTSYAAICVWFLSAPASISSDDAFFFASSLTRFSILDFSPHFPGYPVFVGLGRAVHNWVSDPVEALALTSTLTALLIPAALGLAVWRSTRSLPALLVALALGASLPLLPALAISGLSDGTGLVFFLVFFACLPARATNLNGTGDTLLWWLVAGISLGLSICARPSYGPILAAACAPLLIARPRRSAVLVLGIALIAVPALSIMFAVEGWNYVLEGWRFFQGHLFLWGNTAFAERDAVSWFTVFHQQPLIAALVAMYIIASGALLVVRSVDLWGSAVLAAFVMALAWTLIMQNPENLRHLAPILLLGSMLLSRLAAQSSFGLALAGSALLVNITVLAGSTNVQGAPSPLQQAEQLIDEQRDEALVLTRHGVRYLRDHLQMARVYDLAMPAAALSAVRSHRGELYRITSTPIDQCASEHSSHQRLPARVLGETGLWLVEVKTEELPETCLAGIVD